MLLIGKVKMSNRLLTSLLSLTLLTSNECSSLRIFNPLNYLNQLPSLSMPYINNMPIPSLPLIRPTPTTTTKVINVVTKYVVNSPVCIKVSSKKPICKTEVPPKQPTVIRKELPDNERKINEERQLRQLKLQIEEATKNNNNNGSIAFLEPSELSKVLVKRDVQTPTLNASKLRDLLIEDRLDKLEEILPHYTRLRAYQTSTITVTRTRTNRMIRATLMVKNCIPQGIEYCKANDTKKKQKNKVRRKSKVALEHKSSSSQFSHYFG